MEIGNKLANLAKKTLPVSREFDELIRSIGECKSKGEEDAILARVVEIAKTRTKESRRDARTSKELLMFLIYIDMLGHDTNWARATVIQLCSDKNLSVKKVRAGPRLAGMPHCGLEFESMPERVPIHPRAAGLPGDLAADRPCRRTQHYDHCDDTG
jgi:hypothetical protein